MNLMIESRLRELVQEYGNTTVQDAMSYSLLSGGKRVRPRLLLSLLADYGVDLYQGLNQACALEMIHTYSLVHDDLPAMDNDDFRRFKPTNHKVYGEGMAILAGDGLLTAAFTTLAKADTVSAAIQMKTVEILARNAGAHGMILGQELDIVDNIDSVEALIQCYEMKTGCLFAAALEMAVVIAGKDDLQDTARTLGLKLGVAFQYQDDILEVTKTSDEIGKSHLSDGEREKSTIVTLLGLKRAQNATEGLFKEIKVLLDRLDLNGTELQKLIEEMIARDL
ncbi:polyprenyl synthetase family protein [Erysipelothrix sp. HDW6B]|uniref:polyprenyl synthetase family protein n=1 Tax=Erysipelothrix TaxID=1647 RepID=UPI001356DF64|nr:MULTISPECIES: farnesyl diphosphate synthase [Erysipelothrix]QIK86183.1 polyprenyl synthetase family protein [Erysipelothrix sp. HDW6B]